MWDRSNRTLSSTLDTPHWDGLPETTLQSRDQLHPLSMPSAVVASLAVHNGIGCTQMSSRVSSCSRVLIGMDICQQACRWHSIQRWHSQGLYLTVLMRWTYSTILFNCSWYLYIARAIINCVLTFYHQSTSFVVPGTETMCDLFDYIIRQHSEKGSVFGSVFSPSPHLNWTLWTWTEGSVQGSGKLLNWTNVLVQGLGKIASEPNWTEPYHHYTEM